MTENERNSKRLGRVRLRLDFKERFPEKLYDVVSDGNIIHWDGAGTGMYVSETEYEENVMAVYPGFVQIPTFPNLRRLFRQYGFDWRIKLTDDVEVFEFAHPYFIYGHRHLLNDIQTRRRSYYGQSKLFADVDALEFQDEDTPGKSTYRTRSKYRKRDKISSDKPSYRTYADSSFEDESRLNESRSYKDLETAGIPPYLIDREIDHDAVPSSSKRPKNGRHSSSLNNQIMSLFIKNEFTFDDFCAWVDLNNTNPTEHIGQGDSNVNCNQERFEESVLPSGFPPCHQCACCQFYNTRYKVLDQPCVVTLLDSEDEDGPPETV